MRIELGCFTRPWGKFTQAEALAGVAAAGFGIVGVTNLKDGPPFTADSTEEEIAELRARVEGHGLAPRVLFGNPDVSREPTAGRPWEAVARFRREIERAAWLGVGHIVVMGTEKEERHEAWFRAMEESLDFAGEQGVMLVLKPHGGLSALGEDLLRAEERLRHPSFGICYDPGNIYYYTGQRAEEDLPKVADRVQAMCIKDEQGGMHGDVELTPGTGLVNFERIFAILDGAGFSGPCWVECVGGKSLGEVNVEAKRTFEFVTEVVGRI